MTYIPKKLQLEIERKKAEIIPDMFLEAHREKFEKGNKDHGDDWESIDPLKEAKEELLDLFSYAAHPKFPKQLRVRCMRFARDMWETLMNYPSEEFPEYWKRHLERADDFL